MDREKFKMLFKNCKKGGCQTYNNNDAIDIIKRSIKYDGNTKKKIIAIEEMAELQKELTKELRSESPFDFYGMLEEISDVYICLKALQLIFDISDADINDGIDIKLNRLAINNAGNFIKEVEGTHE